MTGTTPNPSLNVKPAPVFNLVHKPESSLLEQEGYFPIKIEGLTLFEGKFICVSVIIGRHLPDGTYQPVRKELMKTENLKKKWPQMLIQYYEARTQINNKKLMSF